MTTTTSTIETATEVLAAAEQDHFEALAVAADASKRVQQVAELVRSKIALPKGTSLAAANDQLDMANMALDGAVDRLAEARDDLALANAEATAQAVAEPLVAGGNGSATEAFKVAVDTAISDYVAAVANYNESVRRGVAAMRALPEDRFGPQRIVGAVSVDSDGFSSQPNSLVIDGRRFERVSAKDGVTRVVADALGANGFRRPVLSL